MACCCCERPIAVACLNSTRHMLDRLLSLPGPPLPPPDSRLSWIDYCPWIRYIPVVRLSRKDYLFITIALLAFHFIPSSYNPFLLNKKKTSAFFPSWRMCCPMRRAIYDWHQEFFVRLDNDPALKLHLAGERSGILDNWCIRPCLCRCL